MKEAITEKEAIALAKEMFPKVSDYRSQMFDHRTKAYKNKSLAHKNESKTSDHESTAYDHYLEMNDHFSRAKAIQKEGTASFHKMLSEKEIVHFEMDHRAFNINCADREGFVYCFVWVHEEVWIYNGKNCLGSDAGEKPEWK